LPRGLRRGDGRPSSVTWRACRGSGPMRCRPRTVASTWRGSGRARFRWRSCGTCLLAAIDAEHRDHDLPGRHRRRPGCALDDGSLTRVPDNPGEPPGVRGRAGTADDSSPHPQLRVPVPSRARSARASRRRAGGTPSSASAPLRINIAILGPARDRRRVRAELTRSFTSEGATIRLHRSTYLLARGRDHARRPGPRRGHHRKS